MAKVPDYLYTLPSEQRYFDESTSTIANPVVFDATKTGADYGITDPEVFVEEPVVP